MEGPRGFIGPAGTSGASGKDGVPGQPGERGPPVSLPSRQYGTYFQFSFYMKAHITNFNKAFSKVFSFFLLFKSVSVTTMDGRAVFLEVIY